jgi:hypothetical protein
MVGRVVYLGLFFTCVFIWVGISFLDDGREVESEVTIGGSALSTEKDNAILSLQERVRVLENEIEASAERVLEEVAIQRRDEVPDNSAGPIGVANDTYTALNEEVLEAPKNKDFFKWALITTMPCMDTLNKVQTAAIASWEQLDPKPHILVLADCLPKELVGRVTLLKMFDATFDRLPLFSGMMFATLRTAAVEALAVVAWVNADILLGKTVGSTISAAFHTQKIPWLMIGSRYNIPAKSLYDEAHTPQNLGEFIRKKGEPHTTGGVDLFVWNQPHKPVVRAPYPPFIRTANVWDNWWVVEAAATRLVVDGGMHLTLGHIEHDRYDNTGEVVKRATAKSKLLSPWTSSSFTDWHNYHNRALLASEYQRGYTRGGGTPNVVPVQVMVDKKNGLTFAVPTHHKQSITGQRRVTLWRDKRMREFPADPTMIKTKDRTFGIPHNLTSLLSTMDPKRPVILAGTTSGFLTLVMSWICNLQRIGEFQNVLIAAFDQQSYETLYLLGMPVFIPEKSLGKTEGGAGHYSYGNDVYKQVTKMKTAVVVDVLKHHHDVLWCDPDIVLYKPFVETLMTSPYDFQLQQNDPTSLKDLKQLKTNSGFYLVRSKKWVIDALTAVVAHASKSTASEQMSWNAVLCAKQDMKKNQCYFEGHPLQFLNRERYATGNEEDAVWQHVKINKPPKDLVIWHNNWITGYDAKMVRLENIQQLWWDDEWNHCSSGQERKLMDKYMKHKSLPAITTSWSNDWPSFHPQQ